MLSAGRITYKRHMEQMLTNTISLGLHALTAEDMHQSALIVMGPASAETFDTKNKECRHEPQGVADACVSWW